MKKINNYSGLSEITHKEWIDTDECDCGASIFKYHDSTTNIYVVRCGNIKELYEQCSKTKQKIWTISKKQPCSFINIHRGIVPIFLKPVIIKKEIISIDYNKKITKELEYLFEYYSLAFRDTTIQEIDLIVKNKLFRLPRKIYYCPTIGSFLRESHREPMEEYRKRIFSIPIVDKSVILGNTIPNIIPDISKLTITKKKKVYEFIDLEDSNDDSEDSNNESEIDEIDELEETEETEETEVVVEDEEEVEEDQYSEGDESGGGDDGGYD